MENRCQNGSQNHENLSKNRSRADLGSLILGFLAFWHEAKRSRIFGTSLVAQKIRKSVPGAASGSLCRERGTNETLLSGIWVPRAATRATKHEGTRLVARGRTGQKERRPAGTWKEGNVGTESRPEGKEEGSNTPVGPKARRILNGSAIYKGPLSPCVVSHPP